MFLLEKIEQRRKNGYFEYSIQYCGRRLDFQETAGFLENLFGERLIEEERKILFSKFSKADDNSRPIFARLDLIREIQSLDMFPAIFVRQNSIWFHQISS